MLSLAPLSTITDAVSLPEKARLEPAPPWVMRQCESIFALSLERKTIASQKPRIGVTPSIATGFRSVPLHASDPPVSTKKPALRSNRISVPASIASAAETARNPDTWTTPLSVVSSVTSLSKVDVTIEVGPEGSSLSPLHATIEQKIEIASADNEWLIFIPSTFSERVTP